MAKSIQRLFRPKVFRTSALAMAVALAATPGWAQPQDNRSGVIEEVIVTAQRVEESLQDTPVSVAAFSSEELEQLGVSEAGDVGRFTPNLEMRKQSASQDNYAIAIRGVASGETALAIDPTVGVYTDGVYIARSTGLAFDIVDLQRLEVLRGPQGTLFGRNTIGGAINIITQKPKGELALQQSFTYADRDYRKVRTTIDTDKFGDVAAKFSFLRSMKDGLWVSVYTGDDLGETSATALRLAVNWTPTDRVSVDYAYDKSDRESNASTQQLTQVRETYSAAAGGFNPFYGGAYYDAAEAADSPDRQGKLFIAMSGGDESSSDIDGHSVTVEWDWSDRSTVKSITSYREWKSLARGTDFGSFASPADGSLCPIAVYDITTGACGSPVPVGTLVSLFAAKRDSSQRQLSQEFQVVGTLLDERLSYNVGLYYFEEQAHEINPQTFVLPANVVAAGAESNGFFVGAHNTGKSVLLERPFFEYKTDNQSYAIYGQFTYNLMQDLDVTFGYRYTIDEKETTLTNELDSVVGDLLAAPPVIPAAAVKKTLVEDDTWENFNPSLIVDYRWNEMLSTYFKVATGYRSGGFNVRSSTSTAFREPFNEENIISYEIGWKSDLFDRRVRFNGALFHIDYEDRQIAQFEAGAGGASNTIVNAGEQKVDGFEFDVLYVPVTGLRILAGYSYLDVDVEEFITSKVDPVTGFPTNPGVNEDIAGNGSLDNTYAPQHSGMLAIEYEFAPWEIGQLMVRVDANYTDEISFHPQLNLFDESDDHYLINARATLSDIPVGGDGNFRIALWGKNLENKEYRDFGIDFGQLGFAIANYGELRSYGMDFIYEYNR